MDERLFLDTVSTVHKLVLVEQVLKCSNRATAMKVLRLIEASLLRRAALKEMQKKGCDWQSLCRCLIHDNINAHCAFIVDLAPAIWSMDAHVVDYVICVLYKCSLTSSSSGIVGAATTVIVEELRRVLTRHFGVNCDDAWWFQNDLLTLSHTPEKVVLTLCQDENGKYLQWLLDTPGRPDTMRQWIDGVIKEITSRVSGNTAVVG